MKKVTDSLIRFDYDEQFFEEEIPFVVETIDYLVEKKGEPLFTIDECIAYTADDSTHAYRELYFAFASYALNEKEISFTVS
ncbi:hypothetical protein ACM26V_13820 [Salipaludibacillus sp. HK11]|uniref:hypothetical protein n=1 Tax=Salipaludibacillus sp. HK11 TaxID=3394320 RepID=UPI0039FCC56C